MASQSDDGHKLFDLDELFHMRIMAFGEEEEAIEQMYKVNPQHVYMLFVEQLLQNNGNGDWLYDFVWDSDNPGLQSLWEQAFIEYKRIRREQIERELSQKTKRKNGS